MYQQNGFMPLYFDNPYFCERRTLRRAGNALGFAFCLTVVINYLISMMLPVVLAALSLPQSVYYDIINDPFYMMDFQIVFSVLGFAVPFMIAASMMKSTLSELVSISRPKPKTLLPFLLLGFGFCAFANILSNVFSSVLNVLGISDYTLELDLPEGILGFLISVIAVAVVPALVEEFAYRGVFLGALKPFGEGFAIIASSVMFALMHGNFSQIPFAFIVGMALAFVHVKSGSMLTAVLLHFINNFVSVVLSYITADMSYTLSAAVSIIYFSFALLSAALGIILLKEGSIELFKTQKPISLLPLSERVSAFFASPMMIIAYITTAIQIIISELVV